MIRGTKTFKCKKCGHIFKSLDIEWNASILSAPVECPKCGNMTNDTPSIIDIIKKCFNYGTKRK